MLFGAPLEPSRAHDKPSLGLTCSADAYFPELEALIAETLETTPSFISVSLALPPQTTKNYDLGLHWITQDANQKLEGIDTILDHFSRHLQPRLSKLRSTDIFLDDGFNPHPWLGREPWSWRLTRAAFYRLHMPKSDAGLLFDQLNEKAEMALATERSIDHKTPGIESGSIDEITRHSDLRSAAKLREFLARSR